VGGDHRSNSHGGGGADKLNSLGGRGLKISNALGGGVQSPPPSNQLIKNSLDQ